jgi:hypothetical protein
VGQQLAIQNKIEPTRHGRGHNESKHPEAIARCQILSPMVREFAQTFTGFRLPGFEQFWAMRNGSAGTYGGPGNAESESCRF